MIIANFFDLVRGDDHPRITRSARISPVSDHVIDHFAGLKLLGPSQRPTPGPVHRLAIRLQYAAPRPFTAPWGFKSVFMGVRVGSAGRQAWFWPLSDSGPAAT